jgi:hypothetical protein
MTGAMPSPLAAVLVAVLAAAAWVLGRTTPGHRRPPARPNWLGRPSRLASSRGLEIAALGSRFCCTPAVAVASAVAKQRDSVDAHSASAVSKAGTNQVR